MAIVRGSAPTHNRDNMPLLNATGQRRGVKPQPGPREARGFFGPFGGPDTSNKPGVTTGNMIKPAGFKR